MNESMNIGIFVTSMRPIGASQARLQKALFTGLKKLNAHRYHFMVFSYDAAPPSSLCDEMFSYHRIAQYGRWVAVILRARARLARRVLAGWSLLGSDGGRVSKRLTSWIKLEPKHYQQFRDLNVRLLWNLNQHEFPTPVPYIGQYGISITEFTRCIRNTLIRDLTLMAWMRFSLLIGSRLICDGGYRGGKTTTGQHSRGPSGQKCE